MYFDTLLGATPTQKLVIILFWAVSTFLVDFICFSVIFHRKTKKQCLKLLFKAGRNQNVGRLPEWVPKFCPFSAHFMKNFVY